MLLLPLGMAVAAPSLPQERFIQPGRGYGFHGCSIGFLLADAAGAIYATTSGHCIAAPSLSHPLYGVWGDVVAVSLTAPEVDPGTDIALVRIREEMLDYVEPSMRWVGGPSGLAAPGDLPRGAPLAYAGAPVVGQSVTAAILPPRPAIVLESGAIEIVASSAVFPLGGESGSPILDIATGRAVGLVKGAPVAPGLEDRLARFRAFHLSLEIERLGALTGLALRLIEAPRLAED